MITESSAINFFKYKDCLHRRVLDLLNPADAFGLDVVYC